MAIIQYLAKADVAIRIPGIRQDAIARQSDKLQFGSLVSELKK